MNANERYGGTSKKHESLFDQWSLTMRIENRLWSGVYKWCMLQLSNSTEKKKIVPAFYVKKINRDLMNKRQINKCT